jgi:drug/metabolite transporter (DMT)-like permease
MTTPSSPAPISPSPTYPFYLHPYLLLALAISFWAGNVIVGRAVRDTIPPVGLAFWRWTVAFLILLPFGWRQVGAEWHIIRRSWRITLLLSFLGITLFNTLLYTALRYTTALNGTLLQSAMPVFVVGYSYLFFRDGMNGRQLMGLLLSLVGAVVIVAQGNWQIFTTFTFNVGDVLVMIAIITYAGYTALLRLRPPVHPLTFLVVSFGLGALMLLPLYLWESANGFSVPFTPTTAGVIAYVALFPSIVSYLFYNYGVAQLGANRAGVFIHLNPAIASILAVLLLGETFQWFHPVGFGLILAGIVLVARKSKTRVKPMTMDEV